MNETLINNQSTYQLPGDEFLVHDAKYDIHGFKAAYNYAEITWDDFRRYDQWVEEDKILDLSLLIYDTMTAFDNQKIVILVQGPVGSGKSFWALNVLWNVAMRLSHLYYGDVRHWRRFFQPKNIAVMLKEDIDGLIKNMSKHGCYLLDDVFESMDRAQWGSALHQAINSIMVADRTDNTCTVITIPRMNMIDVIVRGLAQYRCDMKRNIHTKRMGFGEFQLLVLFFNPFDQKRGTIPYQKHIKTGYTDWENYYVALPPAELRDWYDVKRDDSLKRLKEMKKNNGKPQAGNDEDLNDGDAFRDWLNSNPFELAKQDNSRYQSSKTIIKHFTKDTKRMVSEGYGRGIIADVRKEMIESKTMV